MWSNRSSQAALRLALRGLICWQKPHQNCTWQFLPILQRCNKFSTWTWAVIPCLARCFWKSDERWQCCPHFCPELLSWSQWKASSWKCCEFSWRFQSDLAPNRLWHLGYVQPYGLACLFLCFFRSQGRPMNLQSLWSHCCRAPDADPCVRRRCGDRIDVDFCCFRKSAIAWDAWSFSASERRFDPRLLPAWYRTSCTICSRSISALESFARANCCCSDLVCGSSDNWICEVDFRFWREPGANFDVEAAFGSDVFADRLRLVGRLDMSLVDDLRLMSFCWLALPCAGTDTS